VRGFGRADFDRFVAEHYGPGQMILSAAGAVDHDQILRLAEALFGHLHARARRRARRAGRASRAARSACQGPEQAHFTLAFEAPGYRDDDIYTAQIYATALGGGMSSRLFQEIREKRGPVLHDLRAGRAYDDTGMTDDLCRHLGRGDRGSGRPHARRDARAAEDMSEAEVDRARAQMKAGLLMGLESPSARAERNARLVRSGAGCRALEETVGADRRGDAARVRDHARALATAARRRWRSTARWPARRTLPAMRERLAA
jgi:predicted Zn-dependent peptidase